MHINYISSSCNSLPKKPVCDILYDINLITKHINMVVHNSSKIKSNWYLF